MRTILTSLLLLVSFCAWGQKVNLQSNVTGILPVLNGGTGNNGGTPRSISGSGNAVLADNGAIITSTGAGAAVVTIPNDSSVVWPAGSFITVYQSGTGAVSFAGDGTSTVTGSFASSQFTIVGAQKVAANSWVVVGPIATTGTAIQKANGAGGLTAATAGTDYFAPTFYQQNVPVGIAPTGTMGNNGAVTFGGGSALISGMYVTPFGAYLWYPAGAIAAGVPAAAAFYWTVMTSTTVGVVYNNVYVPGTPPVYQSSPTAFATTGPGAYTGTTAAITVLSTTMPAGTLGANGSFTGMCHTQILNAAGTKAINIQLGGTKVYGGSASTQPGINAQWTTRNIGNAAAQITTGSPDGTNNETVNSLYTTINTASSQTLTVTLTNNAATDWMVLNGCHFDVRPQS